MRSVEYNLAGQSISEMQAGWGGQDVTWHVPRSNKKVSDERLRDTEDTTALHSADHWVLLMKIYSRVFPLNWSERLDWEDCEVRGFLTSCSASLLCFVWACCGNSGSGYSAGTSHILIDISQPAILLSLPAMCCNVGTWHLISGVPRKLPDSQCDEKSSIISILAV